MSSFLLARQKKARLVVTVRSRRWFIETRSPKLYDSIFPSEFIVTGVSAVKETVTRPRFIRRRWNSPLGIHRKLISLPCRRCFLASPFRHSVLSVLENWNRDWRRDSYCFHLITPAVPDALNRDWSSRAAGWNYETSVLQLTREISVRRLPFRRQVRVKKVARDGKAEFVFDILLLIEQRVFSR